MDKQSSPEPEPAGRPFIVDRVVAVCKICLHERTFSIEPSFRSAEEFTAWMDAPGCPLVRCDCGAEHCDLKLRLADQN